MMDESPPGDREHPIGPIRLYLAYISPISRLYLAYISPNQVTANIRRARASRRRATASRTMARRYAVG